MTYWVIKYHRLKHRFQLLVMCYDLQPTLGRSEVLCRDLKGRKNGLFVAFYGFTPALGRLWVVEYDPKGPKIGKLVICRDHEPTQSRSRVMIHHLNPTRSRTKVMHHHFRLASGRQEMTDGPFRGDATDEGLKAWHPRCVPSVRQGLCLTETIYAETASAVSKQINVKPLNYSYYE